MAIECYFNNVNVTKKTHFWEESYFGLTFEQDPRPKCSLILGDGFTQGFLASQGLKDKIRLSINCHFPPPDELMYVPVKGDRFEKSEIWNRDKWPNLYNFWESSNRPNGRLFYSSLPKNYINPHIDIEKLTYDTSSLGFELRCYLWHFFRSQHYEFMSHIGGFDLNRWEWLKPFKLFLSEFALGVSSFNYDVLAEFLLEHYFQALTIAHDVGTEADYLRRPSDSIAFYKLHGSISYYIDTGMNLFGGYNANPWLTGVNFSYNSIGNVNLGINYKMESFPEFPDIVPPGHYGEDKLNPRSAVLSLSKSHIEVSQLIVFCGLSAEEPDTDEIRGLIDKISTDTLIIHVGLECDRQNKLAQLLLARGLKSTFLLPEELSSIGEIIGKEIPLYRDWSKF